MRTPKRLSPNPGMIVPMLCAVSLMAAGCSLFQQKSPTTPAAQIRLGNLYSAGFWVPKDDEQAARWYRRAALQGDPDGQLQMGICYGTGVGVPMNDVEAVRWYRLAADNGNSDAQYRLGLCYELGDGVTKDVIQAYKWLNIAAASGHLSAKSYRDAIEHRMTKGEIAKGQALSRDWKPKN